MAEPKYCCFFVSRDQDLTEIFELGFRVNEKFLSLNEEYRDFETNHIWNLDDGWIRVLAEDPTQHEGWAYKDWYGPNNAPELYEYEDAPFYSHIVTYEEYLALLEEFQKEVETFNPGDIVKIKSRFDANNDPDFYWNLIVTDVDDNDFVDGFFFASKCIEGKLTTTNHLKTIDWIVCGYDSEDNTYEVKHYDQSLDGMAVYMTFKAEDLTLVRGVDG